MKNVTCTFTIVADANGGNLTGGFDNGATLESGDSLTVTVVYPAANGAPGSLDGVFVFSASPFAGRSQTAPSPFVRGANGKFVCVTTKTATGVATGNTTEYPFASIPYGGGLVGVYELTFVAIDKSTTPPTQWSEDPEFDTSS